MKAELVQTAHSENQQDEEDNLSLAIKERQKVFPREAFLLYEKLSKEKDQEVATTLELELIQKYMPSNDYYSRRQNKLKSNLATLTDIRQQREKASSRELEEVKHIDEKYQSVLDFKALEQGYPKIRAFEDWLSLHSHYINKILNFISENFVNIIFFSVLANVLFVFILSGFIRGFWVSFFAVLSGLGIVCGLSFAAQSLQNKTVKVIFESILILIVTSWLVISSVFGIFYSPSKDYLGVARKNDQVVQYIESGPILTRLPWDRSLQWYRYQDKHTGSGDYLYIGWIQEDLFKSVVYINATETWDKDVLKKTIESGDDPYELRAKLLSDIEELIISKTWEFNPSFMVIEEEMKQEAIALLVNNQYDISGAKNNALAKTAEVNRALASSIQLGLSGIGNPLVKLSDFYVSIKVRP